MVRTVFWWFFWGLIVVLILAWLVGGGIGKIQNASKHFSFTGIWSGVSVFDLPWAVPIPQGPDLSSLGNTTISSEQSSQAQTFGNQSPYASSISLSADGATASDPQAEYLVIQNTGTQPIDISGWSVQSVQTGARAYIPLGASFFLVGQLNQQTNIDLAPNGVAVVTTGVSPVGTSFRENECSGYLEQLQQYTPPIQTQCPSPGNDVSKAGTYGQSCADYVSSLPFCTFPKQPPSNLSAQCQVYVQTTFSYNGCVAQYQNDSNFPLNDWRLYLNTSHELWNNSHDTIRLLDAEGQTVAVASY